MSREGTFSFLVLMKWRKEGFYTFFFYNFWLGFRQNNLCRMFLLRNFLRNYFNWKWWRLGTYQFHACFMCKKFPSKIQHYISLGLFYVEIKNLLEPIHFCNSYYVFLLSKECKTLVSFLFIVEFGSLSWKIKFKLSYAWIDYCVEPHQKRKTIKDVPIIHPRSHNEHWRITELK